MHEQFRETFLKQDFVSKAFSATEYSKIDFTVSDTKKLSIQYIISDIWSLASLLTSESFINIIDDGDDGNLDYQNEIQPEWTLEELIKYTDSDRRIRKSRLLIDWLETCYKKQVLPLNKIRNSTWPVTLRRILNTRDDYNTKTFELNSIHPDAQLHQQGFLMNLDGNDQFDQETILRHIFQLIRCGEIRQAQQVALDNEIYWFVSSLQGVANIFYQQELDMVNHEKQQPLSVLRRGNSRRPIWMRTCWKYAEKLYLKSPGHRKNHPSTNTTNTIIANDDGDDDIDRNPNHDGISTMATLIEMSIYASLCNNSKILLSSPLITSFADKLWVMMKASHESSLAEIIHYHRVLKSNHSAFYPGCDETEIQAEKEMIVMMKETVAAFHFPTITYHELFDVLSPSSSSSFMIQKDKTMTIATTATATTAMHKPIPNAEVLLLQLQIAFMQGRDGLYDYIENTVKSVVSSTIQFPYRHDVLLTYSILILWIYKPTQYDSIQQLDMMKSLSDIVSDTTLHIVVEAYIDHLIETDYQRRQDRGEGVGEVLFIMPYIQSLCSARRVAKMMEYIFSIEEKKEICFVKDNDDDDDDDDDWLMMMTEDEGEKRKSRRRRKPTSTSTSIQSIIIRDIMNGLNQYLSTEEITNILLLIICLPLKQYQRQQQQGHHHHHHHEQVLSLYSLFDSLQICGYFHFKHMIELDSFVWLETDSKYSFFKIEHAIRTITYHIIIACEENSSSSTSSSSGSSSIESIEPILNELLSNNKTVIRQVWDMNSNNTYDSNNPSSSSWDPSFIFPLQANSSHLIKSIDSSTVYTAVKDTLLLFIQYSQALQSFHTFHTKVHEFQIHCSRMKMSMMETSELNVSEIESVAQVAVNHILSMIQCDESDYIANGITELWKNAETACMIHFKLNILALEESVACIYKNQSILIEQQQYQQQQGRGGGESGIMNDSITANNTTTTAATTTPRIVQFKNSEKLDKFIQLFYRVFPRGSAAATTSATDDVTASAAAAALNLNHDFYQLCITLIKRIPDAMKNLSGLISSSFISNLIYSIELNILKCILNLQDLIQIRKSSRIMTSSLIGKYIDICTDMDNIYNFLKNEKQGNYWKSQSLNMLSILAAEDSSLKLYNTILKKDLKVHMKKIMKVIVDHNFI